MQVTSYAHQKSELPERIGQPECQFYLKTGTCKFGAQCKYHHPQLNAGSARGPPQLNFSGLPMRPGEKECVYYLRTGSCKFGVACKFHHPEPSGIGSILPSILPIYSNSAPVSPVPSWPIARPAYMPGSGFPVPSPYMPVLFSSSQSIPMTGWNAYQSPGSHVPLDGQLQGFIYGTQQHVERGRLDSDGSSGGPSLFSFPQRPGQPDCHFYMKTGLCKFGANCRYHHPKNTAISLLPATMSPMGLPLRPGLPLCTFYLEKGICKFGPLCKFDHPIKPPCMPSASLHPPKETFKVDEPVSLPMVNNDCGLVQSPESSQNDHGSVTESTEE